MPRYFFDTDDGERQFRDEVGLELPDLEAVAAETFGLLRDLAHGHMSEGRRVMTTHVRGDDGVLVYRGEMTVDGHRLQS